MNKCSDCNESYDATQKARYKCNGEHCQSWTHKQCSDKRQFSIEGYWYCKVHIEDIPLEKRRSNVNENKESSEKEDSEDEKNKIELDNKINIIDDDDSNSNKNSKIDDQSNDHFSSLMHSQTNDRKSINSHITVRNNKAINVIPFDNDDDYNPFSNFNCEECNEKFTKDLVGVLCIECRSTYHLNCLNESELEEVKHHKFVCQSCIEDQIRHNNLNNVKSKAKLKKNDKEIKHFTSSTPRVVHSKFNAKTHKKLRYADLDSSGSLSASSSLSDTESTSSFENETKLIEKYKKLKKLLHKRKDVLKSKSKIDYNSDDTEEENDNISQSDAMIGIYKLTKEEREKSKYEKLPIVDNIDTKWAVFYDLFEQSRKLFSDAENILRIQRSIKSKEILEIGE
ncbi:uncharacterized protein PF3D7_1225600-like [Chironomus tepperi]|uniref:uncharacterized protein PF3D7_1225600-like n=1 Tax=Chironomus tepperi TaxID=113505 RepID=UPI00391F3229